MDWQLIATLVLMLLASCYLARRAFQLWKSRKKGCAGGCGCTSAAPAAAEKETLVPISLDKLAVRLRKPQVR